MNIDNIMAILGGAGFTAIGASVLVKILVEKGIESAIKHNFDRHLETYKSELTREIERLKLSLKNSEVFFSRQFAALTELRKMSRSMLPRKRNPDMDFYEACWEVATEFSRHADSLDEFLYKYEPVLPTEILKQIESAAALANDGSFEFHLTDSNEPMVTDNGIKIAEQLYDLVRDASLELQKTVDSQVDGRK
ncbi:hypothetical protein DFR29_104403 [Tahibacter aquaticus]|uniref:Uncharacterized protein n=1 Tax=Tahibacter aquaticus TaxID=520092 RepID=A0A4V3DMU1_9GAMM|nr:hypothetical protein [Tahibacter aquaticus]TDR45966.1 hypothetical protein DFR29_104403 [Tahibacter aquaticus]